MLRVERPSDARAVAELFARTISAGHPAMGWDPERLTQIIERLSRWDARRVLGFAAAIGKAVPCTFIDTSGGTLRGAVAWSPGRRVGWVAALGIDPEGSDAGLLERLLERCLAETRLHRLGALLVPGSLLPQPPNPYGSMGGLGFRSLGGHRRYLLDGARVPPSMAETAKVRRFRRRDADRLARFAASGRLPDLEALEPAHPADLGVSGWLSRALGSTTAAFVHEGANGADAFVRATRSSASSTAHLALVIDPRASPIAGRTVLEGALSWCRRARTVRAIVEAPEAAHHLTSVLHDTGFEPRESWEMWARSVDGAG